MSYAKKRLAEANKVREFIVEISARVYQKEMAIT